MRNEKERIPLRAALDEIFRVRRNEMMAATLGLYRLMDRTDWFRALGVAWTGCEDIYEWQRGLRMIFSERLRGAPTRAIREMMDDRELAAYDALPDRVTVYRGCHRLAPRGLCWTLDRGEAEWFAGRIDDPRYRVILEARIPKRSIVAVEIDRAEAEVVIERTPTNAKWLTPEPDRFPRKADDRDHHERIAECEAYIERICAETAAVPA